MLATFKLVPRPQFFYHILSHLVTTYHTLSHPLGWKGNHLMLATSKLVPKPNFLITYYHAMSLLVIPYHTLSPRSETKVFSFSNCKISSQAPTFLSHFITPCHTLSHLITPYPLGQKQKYFHLATVKLVPRPLLSYHILSRLVTPYHTLSCLIP